MKLYNTNKDSSSIWKNENRKAKTYDLILSNEKYMELLFYSSSSLLEIFFTLFFTKLFCTFHHHSFFY